MKNIIIIFYSALSMFSCSNAEEYRRKANELENRGYYKEAIEYLDKAIEINPFFIDAYIDRGVDNSILENYEKAIYDYSQVIQIDSVNTLAYFNRAKNYYRVGNIKFAFMDVTQAYDLATINSFKIDSMNIHIQGIYDSKYTVSPHEILFERGLIFLKMDSLDKAYADINNCIYDEELSAHAYYWRGIINQKRGDTISACQDLNIALNHGVKDAENLERESINNAGGEDESKVLNSLRTYYAALNRQLGLLESHSHQAIQCYDTCRGFIVDRLIPGEEGTVQVGHAFRPSVEIQQDIITQGQERIRLVRLKDAAPSMPRGFDEAKGQSDTLENYMDYRHQTNGSPNGKYQRLLFYHWQWTEMRKTGKEKKYLVSNLIPEDNEGN